MAAGVVTDLFAVSQFVYAMTISCHGNFQLLPQTLRTLITCFLFLVDTNGYFQGQFCICWLRSVNTSAALKEEPQNIVIKPKILNGSWWLLNMADNPIKSAKNRFCLVKIFILNKEWSLYFGVVKGGGDLIRVVRVLICCMWRLVYVYAPPMPPLPPPTHTQFVAHVDVVLHGWISGCIFGCLNVFSVPLSFCLTASCWTPLKVSLVKLKFKLAQCNINCNISVKLIDKHLFMLQYTW